MVLFLRYANVRSGYMTHDYDPRDGHSNVNNDFDVENRYLSDKIFLLSTPPSVFESTNLCDEKYNLT